MGVLLNINLNSEKDEDDNKDKTSVIAIGPSVRYYLLDTQKFMPFAEGKIAIGGTIIDDSKLSLFAFYLSTGGTYFFKPKIGIDFTLGYGSMVVKDKDSQSNSKMTISLVNFGAGMLIGF